MAKVLTSGVTPLVGAEGVLASLVCSTDGCVDANTPCIKILGNKFMFKVWVIDANFDHDSRWIFSCAGIVAWSMCIADPNSEPWFQSGDPLKPDLTVDWSWLSVWEHSCSVSNILLQMMLMQFNLSVVQVSLVKMEPNSAIDKECELLS